ncbi:hypothetical protein H8E77_26680, partial [bacterium]|nr:hypothetical protein [bacterium]
MNQRVLGRSEAELFPTPLLGGVRGGLDEPGVGGFFLNKLRRPLIFSNQMKEGIKLGKIVILKFWWLICIAILITMSGCKKESEAGKKTVLTPVNLLPGDNDISGWIRENAYDEANDHDSLYALIDGAGEVFIENGFVSAAFQQYTSGTLKVHLRIYNQGNEANAKKIYDKLFIGVGIPWDGAGTAARIDETGLASYMVEFWQRNF